MKVCIAEKPSVAREIANILGANTKRDGFYEGNGYAVTYTFGHLCTLLEPKDYKPHWKSWDLNNLPMLPERFDTKVTGDSGIKKQFNIVKSLFEKADVVINCGDAGTEGELIQRWVINQCNYKGKVQRLWISSLTEEAIKDGFNNLESSEKYDNLYYAGYSRAIGDWLLGLNATRLYTVKFGGYKQVLSVGRVQTPTLAMLVNRYFEIQNFKPQPYWELQTTYRNTLFNYEDGRFLKKEDGQVLADKVAQSDFEIVSVTKKKGKEYAPKLFDLTGLQVYCNNKFGFSADETLKIVQKLYEMKVVTYPRVDTTFLPNDLYPKIHGILSKLTNYSELTQPLLGKKIKKTKRVFDDKKVTDHHAIIPTGIQGNLQYNQQQVYDIITRRFIAVFYPDSDVSNTSVIGKAAEVPFKTTGKEIINKGWRIVFEKKESSIKKELNAAATLPSFTKGEKGKHEPSFLEKETKPPRNYTEASLLRAMETAGKQVDDDEMRELMKENGIGRPSTRASIIETLFRRKYIERKKKLVLPTQTGIDLINIIDNELLKSAELTGRWEKRLKEIERGEFNAGTFINNMKKMVDQLVYEVRSNTSKKRISAVISSAVENSTKKNTETSSTSKKKQVAGKTCPKCKTGKLLKGSSAYGCSEYKNNCNFKIPFKIYDKKVSENQIIRLIDKGCTTNLKGFVFEDKKVEGLIRFDDNFNLRLEPKKQLTSTKKVDKLSDKITCPKCKKGTILKGKTAYGCSEYKTGCDFVFTFENIKKMASGQPLTKELVLEILNQ
ncbi:DNA topoisomerase III [Polaribacter reichenbachii]|uniref:DNA topoisomerase n=1 Tax=Polaribacter reichenbachii TaxID=996801 RepID=A0A1B8TZT0_9FLAO|nr:DNA topoisomerase 3 [Polaribacter reichenbachii]APZ47194.1 DNA topoisomerase III [Polaribacter reichenbachii]AUC17834.1 DNA topoisomerase III [Polaribacter reichenbachii]OBY65141.1 DNA topoisomerase III [Polaribacter reichenbachii]